MENENINEAGVFALTSLKDVEYKDLWTYLDNDFINVLRLWMTDDMILCLLDGLSNTNVKVPSRSSLYRAITNIKIIRFIKDKGFSDERVALASRVFGRSKDNILKVWSGYCGRDNTEFDGDDE